MRPQARVLAQISVMPKLLCAVYQQLELLQMLAAEQLLPGQAAWVALPSIHHGENRSYRVTIYLFPCWCYVFRSYGTQLCRV
jgi:hypothetical protein